MSLGPKSPNLSSTYGHTFGGVEYNPPVHHARTPEDLAGWTPEAELGFPGEFPFTRGIHPTMYRSRLWTMRQYAGFATAEESNARYRYLLAQGVSGLSVAFDLPTQIGYDPDHPLAAGEVGRVGVSIASIDDMAALFDGIPLDRVSTSMTINATAIILLSLYVAVAKRQGVALAKLSGTIQNDILKEYIARGTYIYPPRPSMRLVTDILAFGERELPNWNTISISGYHIREAGSTAVQEVAFTFANAIAYVQAAIDAGLDVNQFGQRLSFFFNAHNNFLEEIAKFRAARRLWARIMRDRFGATNPRAQQLRFHTQTAGSTLTAQQPDNNIVRVALQALAAVLGGTQSLHCNGRDEALALPTEESARIALRTQQIIAAESGVANTVDPVAGSYAIETPHQHDRAGGAGDPGAHRTDGRNARGDRERAHPARDSGIGVPGAAGDRCRPLGRRRRQQVRGKGVGSLFRGEQRKRLPTPFPDRSRRSKPRQIARLHALRASRDRGRVAGRRSPPSRGRRPTAAISCRRSSRPWKRARPSGRSPTRCGAVFGEFERDARI